MLAMKEFSYVINKIQSVFFTVFIFFLPLFFLPITRDPVIISKFYYLVFGVTVLFVLALINFFISKKFVWISEPFTQVFVLFVLSLVLSVLLMSPNKMQALFNPQFGLLLFFSLLAVYYFAYYFYATANKNRFYFPLIIIASGFVVSLSSIIFLINPLKNMPLPANLTFLKTAFFNTVGSQIELIVFQLFILLLTVVELRKAKPVDVEISPRRKDKTILFIVLALVIGLSTFLEIFQVAKSVMSLNAKFNFPPINVSWYAAVEVLKNPLTALFGVGIDNFASIFSRVKDINYNISDYWQISAFSFSRSAILHILTVTGVLGLISFLLLVGKAFSLRKGSVNGDMLLFIYALVVLLIFPTSLISWFLFFVTLIFISHEAYLKQKVDAYEVHFHNILPLFIAVMVIGGLFLLGTIYMTGRTFASEIYFQKALEAASENNLKGLYENEQRAINLYPYNEDFRINFSQANMIVANNLASKKELTDPEKQTITQAIQAAIAEAKAAVSLNPTKAGNWIYLASLYRDIINVAQGAESWTVSAYQQAIALDPQNPALRLQLGGIFYLFQNYDEAQKLFEQAVSLKGDWSNAYYNLAWALYQKKDYVNAVSLMEKVISLIDPKTAKADFKKAESDLGEFRKMLPTPTPSPEGQPQIEQKSQNLQLPSPPPKTIEPKLELPKESSPEGAVQEGGP